MIAAPYVFAGPRYAPTGFHPAGFAPDSLARQEILVRDTIDGADTVLAVLAPDATTARITGAPNTERYARTRRVNACGLGDLDDDQARQRRVAFDDAGNLILPAADGPLDLTLVAGPAGLVTAHWRYHRTRTFTATTDLPAADAWWAYVAVGGAAMDFAVPPAATKTGAGRRHELALGTYAHDTLVRVVVRSVTADGVHSADVSEASVTADAQAPDTPAVVTTSIEAGRYG